MITDQDRMEFVETHPGWLKKIPGAWRWVCADPALQKNSLSMYDTAREAIDEQIANQRKDE